MPKKKGKRKAKRFFIHHSTAYKAAKKCGGKVWAISPAYKKRKKLVSNYIVRCPT